jgi:hypothetical protein
MRSNVMTSDENQSLSDDAAQRREPTVGQQLRAARDAQSLSLAQVSAQLRIEPQFLTCLEQDRFEVFSAPVFAKGYLKQYGHVLGLVTSPSFRTSRSACVTTTRFGIG